jgi:DNA-binding XRE family transcriptional regulator
MTARITYQVWDTFNDQLVSKHYSQQAAEKAEKAFHRAVKHANGRDSYIPTRIVVSGASVTPKLFARLKTARKEAGLTQAEAATLLGLSRRTYQWREANEDRAQVGQLERDIALIKGAK